MRGPPFVVAITGPTASGKTALSIEVAERIGAEIISMDSRQVYRGMDIGTAKVPPELRARIPHHGLDLVSPDERYSAGRFGRDARTWIAGIVDRGHVPLLVGGTGFFLRALTHPIFREPPLDRDRRWQLSSYLRDQPDETLHRWLLQLDAPLAGRLRDWGGRQRLLRALELPLLTGRPLSWWQTNAPPEADPVYPLVFVLRPDRARLASAINDRVARMAAAGLVEEVRALSARGYDEHSPGMNATGYIELLAFLRGEMDEASALEAIRANTRSYSKRQMTWFRNQLPPDAIWLDADMPGDLLVETVVSRTRAWLAGSEGAS